MKDEFFINKLSVLIILILIWQDCYSQDTIGYHYEFRIFKDCKVLTDKVKKTRVEAGVYDFEKKQYQKLVDHCLEPDKYCFDYCYEPNYSGVQFFLKIFAGKDSMIVLSDISLDSLVFKPGQYYFSSFNRSRFNIFPANKSVTIEQINPNWSIVFNKYPFDRKDRRGKFSINWYDTIRSVSLDTSFKWVSFWDGLLTINPRDTSLFLKAMSGALRVSRDHGKNWTTIHPYFKDVIVDICISNENSEYFIIMREGKYFKAEPEAYLKSGQVLGTTGVNKREEIQCQDHLLPETLRFKREFIQDSKDVEFIEDDSGTVTGKLKGEPVFLFRCHANYASQKQCRKGLFYDHDDSYMKASNCLQPPVIYYLGSRILLEFADCFLYSDNGKNWHYYSITDFYFSPEALERYAWKEKNISAIYLLDDKRLLIDINYCGMFSIDLDH